MNNYQAKVFISHTDDCRVKPLVRALHSALCGGHLHKGNGYPICAMAARVVGQWVEDDQPQLDDDVQVITNVNT